MTDSGMTVRPGSLREIGAALAGHGHRVRGLGFLLDDDAPGMAGSRAYGALIHGALLWRGELAAEGDGVEALGLRAGDIAGLVEQVDAANGGAP